MSKAKAFVLRQIQEKILISYDKILSSYYRKRGVNEKYHNQEILDNK